MRRKVSSGIKIQAKKIKDYKFKNFQEHILLKIKFL